MVPLWALPPWGARPAAEHRHMRARVLCDRGPSWLVTHEHRCGDRAIRHQTQSLHMHRYSPYLIHPPCCVLPTCQQCQCSQHHKIFDCTAVRPLWAATKRLGAELGDPDPIPTDIYEYFRMLLIHGNTAKSPHGPIDTKVLLINLVTLTLKAITNAYYTKMQEYEKQKGQVPGQPDPAKPATQHRSNLRRPYIVLLREEVKQFPRVLCFGLGLI